LCQSGFANAARATKQNIFAPLDEIKRAVQAFINITINFLWMIPVETIDGLEFSKRCLPHTCCEIFEFSFASFYFG